MAAVELEEPESFGPVTAPRRAGSERSALGSRLGDRRAANAVELEAPGDPDPALLAAAALAVMRASLRHWLTVDRSTPLPTLVQRAFDRFGAGLRGAG